MVVLRAVTIWPAVVVSGVLVVAGLSLAPARIASPAVLAAAVLVAVLAAGGLERPAVILVTGSRSPTSSEQAVMASAVADASAVGVPGLEMLVRRRQGPSGQLATVVGARCLVVAPELIEAVWHGWVDVDEVVALVAHASAARRLRRPVAEVAVQVAMIPWLLMLAVVRAAGLRLAGLPVMRAAWALRGVIAAICVAHSLDEGRLVAGVLGGVVIVLTYAVPAAAATLDARAELAADRFVVDHGMGPALAICLVRFTQSATAERLARLNSPSSQQHPHRPRRWSTASRTAAL